MGSAKAGVFETEWRFVKGDQSTSCDREGSIDGFRKVDRDMGLFPPVQAGWGWLEEALSLIFRKELVVGTRQDDDDDDKRTRTCPISQGQTQALVE